MEKLPLTRFLLGIVLSFFRVLNRLDDWVRVRVYQDTKRKRGEIKSKRKNSDPSRGEELWIQIRSEASNFGWAALDLMPIAIIILLVGFLGYLYFTPPADTPETGLPQEQIIIETLAPPAASPWQDHQWLSQADALNLRSQENVVNLAHLRAGGVRYSASFSVVFAADSPWQQVETPIGIPTYSISGTTVTIRVDGQLYTLNAYQPFVSSNRPNMIYVIDDQGQVWITDLADVSLSSLEEVQNSLPITLSENPDLSLSF